LYLEDVPAGYNTIGCDHDDVCEDPENSVRKRNHPMQIYHILPTVSLINNETLLQRVARSMTTWRRTAIAHVPTQMLSPELFASADDAEYAYETAFAIQATELVLLHG
jgi:hypothetical protein